MEKITEKTMQNVETVAQALGSLPEDKEKYTAAIAQALTAGMKIGEEMGRDEEKKSA